MAAALEIDAVINPADTRHWLTRALEAARVDPATPGRLAVDAW